MLKKKFCNFRPFLIITIAMIVSIIFAVFVFDAQITKFFVFLFLLFISVALLVAFIFVRQKVLLVIISVVLLMAMPYLNLIIKTNKINENQVYNNLDVVVLGKIDDYYRITKNGYLELILDKVEIGYDSNVNFVDGKIIVYSNPEYLDLSELKVGAYVIIKLTLDFNTIDSKDGWQLADLGENIIAVGFADYYNIKLVGQDSSLSEVIKAKVFDTLKSSGMENAEVAYAMMFGDTNVLDIETKDIYRGTGIAHLLAVSGLHVSMIVYAISFLLKKMKLNQKFQLGLLIALLGFYAYLCNFSASVIRASMMAVILNYSYTRGKPYDRLSVLSMLAAIMMLINPLEIFNLSFVLSFLAVFSIILLARPITRLFEKIFYSKFANMLGVLFAIQIGLSFVNIYYFGNFQPLSFLANFISIPLATFSFIMIIIAMIICMVFPHFYFLCQWIGEIFGVIAKCNNYIKNLDILVTVPSFSVFVIPFAFAIMFILSDYCFCKKSTKFITSLCLSTICIALFFV